jgi:hypothetical protein
MKLLKKPNNIGYLLLVQEIEEAFKSVVWVANNNRKKKLVNEKGNSCPALVKWDYVYDVYKVPRFDELNPKMVSLFEKLLNKYYPEVQYNSFTVNRNAEMKPHKDKGNFGNSFIMGFGDYKGGELMIDSKNNNDDLDKCKWNKININKNPLEFDGKSHYHKVAPFTGDRYTLVAYYI